MWKLKLKLILFRKREFCVGDFTFWLRIVMNTRSSWADLAANSAAESTKAGSSANNGSVGTTSGNAPTRPTYVPPHLRNRVPSSDPPAAAYSGPASSNDRSGYGGGSRWGVPRNDYRGGYGGGGGRGGWGNRGGWDRGREREVDPFGSDRASTRLGGFHGIKASNKGVIVLKGMSCLWLKVFSFFLFKGLCSVILFPFSATHNGNFRGCSFVAIFILTRLV